MRSSPKLRPCFWDGLVVLAVIVLAVACGLRVWTGEGGTEDLVAVVRMDAEVPEDGQTEIRIPLEGLNRVERTVNSNGYTLRIILTETEVWVEVSDCPTQDCVHTGRISRGGESIVCLPARVIIQLEGGTPVDTGVDAVVG